MVGAVCRPVNLIAPPDLIPCSVYAKCYHSKKIAITFLTLWRSANRSTYECIQKTFADRKDKRENNSDINELAHIVANYMALVFLATARASALHYFP